MLSLFQNYPKLLDPAFLSLRCRLPSLPCPVPTTALLPIAPSTLCYILNLQLSTSLLLSIQFIQIKNCDHLPCSENNPLSILLLSKLSCEIPLTKSATTKHHILLLLNN